MANSHPPLWRALYPFESHFITIAGHRLHYLDEGPRDAPAVVLLHGNPTWSFYWREVVRALRGRFRVVAPDHLGCGLSDKPQDWPYRLAGHVDNLERLILDLGLRDLTLGVHDWGGAIGMGFAIRHPDRIARLAVFNTAAFPSRALPLRIAVCRVPGLGAFAVRGLNAFARAATFMASVPGVRGPVKDGYLAPYGSWRDRIALHRFVQDIPMGPSHPSWADLLAIEAGLCRFRDRPVLLVWGERDFCFTPAFREEWQRRFPGAQTHALADAGHYVVEDAVDRVVPILERFLESGPSHGRSRVAAEPDSLRRSRGGGPGGCDAAPLSLKASVAALDNGSRVNVARYLPLAAEQDPDGTAILAPARRGRWTRVTYRQLDARSDAIAHGLLAHGLTPGEPTLLMVRAGVPLITLTYACFKAGMVPILIDPGMGREAFLRCVAESRPTAFVGIPLAHAARLAFPAAFRTVQRHVTFGTRFFWGGASLAALERRGAVAGPFPMRDPGADETAAILFTSGSTGPAKGVVYTHGMFEGQVQVLGATYGFGRGEIDLAAFPLFSLFDCAFGMTSLIPELDPSRPGECAPERVVAAIREHGATSAFGSPAIWRRVAPWCLAHGVTLPTLRRVLVAGAPVPPALIEQLHRIIAPDGDVHTPYGASEALPVSTMAGREVVAETAALTRAGAGTCVGRPVGEIDVRLIRVTDDPLPGWSHNLVVPDGEVGEICVKGRVVTRAYHHRPPADAAAKIADGDDIWHRMGDLGYRDAAGRLWFCGRKAERVETARGPLYPDRVEGMANAHPLVTRSALVGVGERGYERPVLVVEGPAQPGLAAQLLKALPVEDVLYYPRLPVDVRHNAKIHRSALKAWAERRVRDRREGGA